MGEMYGHTWASQQGDDPNDTWIRGLQKLTNEQFGAGLRACINRPDTFPPTLPEFLSMCTGHDPDSWRRQAHKIYEPETLIEDITKKEANHEAGNSALSELQGLFK